MQAHSTLLAKTRYCTVKRITYACFVLPALILYLITVVFPFFQGFSGMVCRLKMEKTRVFPAMKIL